jgi:hypothetical protein
MSNKSKEVQKREFISSLKRLITFFNHIPTYEPSQKTIDESQMFQSKDFEQQYKIFEYKQDESTNMAK